MGDGGFRIADGELRMANCGWRIADGELRISDCGFGIADFGLWMVDWLRRAPRQLAGRLRIKD